MDNALKRILLFLIGCMGARLALVYIAYTIPLKWLPYMGMLAIVPALGFTIIYLGGLRKTGAEVFGERIWWNDLRPLHALLYGLFAYFALRKEQDVAWRILLLDVCVGFTAWVWNRYSVKVVAYGMKKTI